jgi:transposase InsO family protein
MAMSIPEPSKAEAKALFRLGIVGDLLARELSPGELRAELLARAQERYRAPGATSSRQYHWKTLQAWYYAAKRGGHRSLIPKSRKVGFALALRPDQRELLLQIRTDHPAASATLILDTAVRQGTLAKGEMSVSTLRRLFAEAGLSRSPLNRYQRRDRRRWDAGRVGALWHGDVCHVWVRDLEGNPLKIYVHGLLDDHSRYVVALEARAAEREVDALSVLCGAMLRFPAPDALYLDNGSCYRGEVLALATARLDVKLVHAKPHDPQSRGKMERFWRTMRMRCTDHLARGATLHDVNAALLAFLDADYHGKPHSGLMGESPAKRFQAGLAGLPRPRAARELASALEISMKRRVAGDATFSVDGEVFEVAGRHLANQLIDIVLDPFDGAILRASFQGKPVVVGRCSPALNRRRRWPDHGRRHREPARDPSRPSGPGPDRRCALVDRGTLGGRGRRLHRRPAQGRQDLARARDGRGRGQRTPLPRSFSGEQPRQRAAVLRRRRGP